MHRWLSLLLCIVSFCLIPITAFAHPGRTDANGGHWDSSTGEYHYHHGYSAHDHYDMNGDGVVDCPYDFVDRTGRNSGTPSGSKTSSSIYEKVPAETVTVYKDREVIKEVPYTPPLMKWALCMCIFMIFFLLAVILIKSSENAKLRESICHLEIDLKRQKEDHDAELKKQEAYYMRMIDPNHGKIRKPTPKEDQFSKPMVNWGSRRP